jgi:hypothetical protein
MQKHYEVRYRIWEVGKYTLKKGDIVTVVDRNEHEICVNNVYFDCPIWVRIESFNNHVVESN